MTYNIDVIQGVKISRIVNVFGEIVRFRADADEDNDGSGGNPEHDPCHKNDTTEHVNSLALDAYKVPFIVVPPVVCQKTDGIVLGSECLVTNITNGRHCLAVVGDIGPHHKIGEMSPACAKFLGLHITAFNGEERHIIDYEIHVGKPALIDGVQYRLQSWKSR